jgi:hypothetical protein
MTRDAGRPEDEPDADAGEDILDGSTPDADLQVEKTD